MEACSYDLIFDPLLCCGRRSGKAVLTSEAFPDRQNWLSIPNMRESAGRGQGADAWKLKSRMPSSEIDSKGSARDAEARASI